MKIFNALKFNKKPAHLPVPKASWAFTLVLLLTASGSYAQSDGNNTGMMMLVGLVAIVAVLVLLVAIYTLQVLKKIEQKQQESGATSSGEESMWKLFLKVANNRADADKEADILMDHDYDGIKELDNHLPPWWKWLFYITIIWGVVYLIGHHFTGWFPLQEEEYATEMEQASAAKMARQSANKEAGGFDEASLVYSDDADILASGGKLFSRNCVPCHGAAGGGNTIGPNLTDKYWLHGGGIKNVYTTIKVGVPAKGMISWQSQLSPTQIRDVATYVLSLQGSNPAGGKAPQGKLEGEETESSANADVEASPEEVEEVATDTNTSGGDTPDGKNIFETTCAACHTADGGGVVGLGPNLTDKYWKNNNGTKEGIIGTVTGGVAGTAMMAWSASLNEAQIEAVTDYVLSLQGTTPANPKAPEGDLYE